MTKTEIDIAMATLMLVSAEAGIDPARMYVLLSIAQGPFCIFTHHNG